MIFLWFFFINQYKNYILKYVINIFKYMSFGLDFDSIFDGNEELTLIK